MPKVSILINLEKRDYDDLHKLMNLSLQSEDGITIFRLFSGNVKQEFYRMVISEGIKSLYQKFLDEKKKLKDENKDSNRG